MPKLPKLSPWKEHVERWKDCEACELCAHRRHVVLAAGKIPCDVLFIGEAPGLTEDTLGSPFSGPAGSLLKNMIEESGLAEQRRIAFTNLVACIPFDEEGSKKVNEPPRDSIEACSKRLNEFVRLAKPRVIVRVGKLAEKHIIGQAQFGGDYAIRKGEGDARRLVKFFSIIHPAYLLRADEVSRAIPVKKTLATLADILEV